MHTNVWAMQQVFTLNNNFKNIKGPFVTVI